MASRSRTFASLSSVTCSSFRNPCGLVTRESDGPPARYRFVSSACASGVELVAEDTRERLLRGPRQRTVVVGEIEVRDPEVERAEDYGARNLERVDAAEVVPEAERHARQQQTAPAAALVGHDVIAV